MSVMCSMNQCTRQRGMCGHETMILAVMVMLIAAVQPTGFSRDP